MSKSAPMATTLENSLLTTTNSDDTSDSYQLVTREQFDRLVIPSPDGSAGVWEDLTGEHGTYRNRDLVHKPLLIDARNDWEAVASFLANKPRSEQTRRSYQKECLRLLLMCRFYFHKPLSSLTLEDVKAYKGLLLAPPKGFVYQRRRITDPDYVPPTLFVKRRDKNGLIEYDPDTDEPILDFNPGWRPFQKPLSASSATTAMSVLKSLMAYLVDTHYLSVTPFKLSRARPDDAPTTVDDSRARNALGKPAQQALAEALDALPDKTDEDRLKRRRLKFLVTAFVTTGARMAEISRARMTDVHTLHGQWWFRAHGKGNKIREIPAVQKFMRDYQDYRLALDLEELPEDKEGDVALVPYLAAEFGEGKASHDARGISEYQIRKILKPVFLEAARILKSKADAIEGSMERADYLAEAKKLEKATPHWFRHTYATNLHDKKVDPRLIKAAMGHSSIDTTMIYSHTKALAQHEAIESALSSAN